MKNRLITILPVLFLLLSLISLVGCGGQQKPAQDLDPNQEITLTVPKKIVEAGVFAPYMSVVSGDDLDELIDRLDLLDAYWEKDGSLSMVTTEGERQESAQYFYSYTREEISYLTNPKRNAFEPCVKDFKIDESHTDIKIYVDESMYKSSDTAADVIKSQALVYVTKYQMYKGDSDYGATVQIINYETDKVIETIRWPK